MVRSDGYGCGYGLSYCSWWCCCWPTGVVDDEEFVLLREQ